MSSNIASTATHPVGRACRRWRDTSLGCRWPPRPARADDRQSAKRPVSMSSTTYTSTRNEPARTFGHKPDEDYLDKARQCLHDGGHAPTPHSPREVFERAVGQPGRCRILRKKLAWVHTFTVPMMAPEYQLALYSAVICARCRGCCQGIQKSKSVDVHTPALDTRVL